ncbi:MULTISPECIES: hypothetical protein [Pseudomonas]|uniref:hypothetical protein n=1 Tax=Pseudomonas TaxID=286 RepID=UPI001F1156A0|nr:MULTISPECIES: hypothetical protein [Pseudomonas]
MSTFAVFGMTRDVALAEAKKRTKCTRKNVKARGLFPLRNGWNSSRRKPSRLWGCTGRQLSPLVDAPQFAEQFIELARKDPEVPRHAHQGQSRAGGCQEQADHQPED